ncbi:E3 ubiquitin-protein ligase RNF31-like isoform X2 [Haemorhous mexicanus]|nr:E3 ubiquitin-protein ligase RNF31-like isoform X2 [Haemorhous mexicanus]XP_059693511.1 E3 ubiquitin-protein ligase RNF31-like isoform X2 [Haemorhous mexicanus]
MSGRCCRRLSLLGPRSSRPVCERPRLARRPQASPAPSQLWPCPRCTFLNRGHAPECEMCGADHAPLDDVTLGVTTPTHGVVGVTSGSDSASSGGISTTSGSGSASSGVANSTSGSADATSGLTKPTSGAGNSTSGIATSSSGITKATSGAGDSTSGVQHSTSGVGKATSGVEDSTGGVASGTSGCAELTSGCGPAPSRDALRQRKLLEDGRRLVELVRAAESQGLPPESLGPAPFSDLPEASGPAPSPESQIRHFRSRLGGVLKALVGAGLEEEEGGASLGPFSLAEAAWAWLEGEGQLERARRALIGRRKQQLRLLASLGFPEAAPVAAALQRQRGSHWGALCELQRLRLRPFRLRQQQGAEPGLDFNQPDQQALVRQILATLPVASWGRALLVASLGRELGLGLLPAPSKEPLLVELVEAVGSCPDRAALRRRLRCECAVCGWGLPRQLMQWLPGCSCPLCPECFRLHFTVG